jgi:hypothetical protein
MSRFLPDPSGGGCFASMVQVFVPPSHNPKLRKVFLLLSDSGGRGFFTMRHTIADVTPSLRAAFRRLDGPAVLGLLRGPVPMLLKHWREMAAVLDTETAAGRLRLTEGDVLEPLLTYYNYAKIRDDSDRLVDKSHVNLVRKSFEIVGWK